MRNYDEIDECADIIDSRDIEGRIDHLESEIDCHESDIEKAKENIAQAEEDIESKRGELDGAPDAVNDAIEVQIESYEESIEEYKETIDDRTANLQPLRDELKELTDFRNEVGSRDWNHGLTLIADSHFEDYARQYAEDLHGEAIRNAEWPFDCIDWKQAASDLQHDFSTATLRGHDFHYNE